MSFSTMRLKIATKIILGFGVMTLFVIVYVFITNNQISKSRKVSKEINEIYTPSVELIRDLYARISDSRMLIKSWVHIDKIADTPDKTKLISLHEKDYQTVMDSLLVLSKYWRNDTHKVMLKNIDFTIKDTLFPYHQQIMDKLNTFVSYEDPFIVFEVTPMVEDKGEVMEATRIALGRINELLIEQEQLISEMRERSDTSFAQLKNFIFIMLAILVLLAIIITAYTALSLSTPINRTKNMLLSMSRGILPEAKLKEGSDEIGQMAKALHLVVQSLRDVSNFAIQIGKGNFDIEFTPLSDEDVLGHSLIEMREELKQAKNEEGIRAEENRQRTWSSQGVALFSDILRKNNDNLNDLSFEIISNMVQYTNSNQGGIFIVNDNDRDNLFLEMTACYAYDRQKFLQRRIEIGEGLVGRCYQEQEKIFLTDINSPLQKLLSVISIAGSHFQE